MFLGIGKKRKPEEWKKSYFKLVYCFISLYKASASRLLLQLHQHLFVFGFLLAFSFCFDSARVRPHKATGETREYNAKVYSAYLELERADPGQAIDARLATSWR